MTATITFSIEVELGWGVVQFDKLDVLSPDRQAETDALVRILDHCDELEIPITFNVVGHLLREAPLSSYDGGHEDGWFDNIPLANPEEAPLFYAPDLAKRIRETDVDHEICTHTFTHVECAEVSPNTLRWEFDKAIETHEEFGLDQPTSLVPPRHSPPPRDILREVGIEIVRSPRSKAPGYQKATNRISLAHDILTGKQPIVAPRIVDGIAETYCTKYSSLTAPFLQSGRQLPHPIFRTMPRSVRQRLHSYHLHSTLSNTIQRDSYSHLWTHLWDTANDIQWPPIKGFLESVSSARDRGQIEVRTMEELNQQFRAGEV